MVFKTCYTQIAIAGYLASYTIFKYIVIRYILQTLSLKLKMHVGVIVQARVIIQMMTLRILSWTHCRILVVYNSSHIHLFSYLNTGKAVSSLREIQAQSNTGMTCIYLTSGEIRRGYQKKSCQLIKTHRIRIVKLHSYMQLVLETQVTIASSQVKQQKLIHHYIQVKPYFKGFTVLYISQLLSGQ